MKFKHRAFTENTLEMREWLEKLGYTPLRFYLHGKYLFARSCTWSNKNHTWEEPYFETGNDIVEYSNHVDCRSNPQLFKAVTAIREDSDMHQIFFIEGLGDKDDYWVCDTEKFNPESDNLPFEVYAYSKCDLPELQSHFKRA